MDEFAARTGLSSELPPRRYLWTDAFAVCNFFGLAQATAEPRGRELALRLVEQVHHTLGRHRADDSRVGWLSGLGEREGLAHPTRGGLRIGKPLPERERDEPFDEQLEWDRDGQYFHYLTKWMHALDQVARATLEPRFNVWARELARAAWAGFSRSPQGGGRPRLAWKMSIDLTRPLVPSTGQHDALDGFITCAQLETTARALPGERQGPALSEELAALGSSCSPADWPTRDPLGLGGLLMDGGRVAQLLGRGPLADDALLGELLEAALEGLRAMRLDDFREPASRRLAFRELGLSIGLHGLEVIAGQAQAEPDRFPHRPRLRAVLDALGGYARLGAAIEAFWLDPRNREAQTWLAHREINEVMLATCLVPEGVLRLPPLG